MALFTETKTIKKGLLGTALHSEVAKRFSVTIISANGNPDTQGEVLMRRIILGVPGRFLLTNFLFVRRAQAIPVGVILAKPADNSPDQLEVDFEIRTEENFEENP